jgi:hypothetical protein
MRAWTKVHALNLHKGPLRLNTQGKHPPKQSHITHHFSPTPTTSPHQSSTGNPLLITGEDDPAAEGCQIPLSSQRQRTSVANNEPVDGDKLIEIPEDGTVLRHLYQNYHVKAARDGKDTFNAFERLKQKQAGIISLSETNMNWKNPLIRESFQTQLFKSWDNCKYHTSTSNWQSNSMHKPGGTVTMATNRWSGRAALSGADPWGLGRFSYIGMHGKAIDKKQRKLLLITLY